MPIGLSLVQKTIVEDIKVNGIPRSQAALADVLADREHLFTLLFKCLEEEEFLEKIESNSHHICQILIYGLETERLIYEWSDDRR